MINSFTPQLNRITPWLTFSSAILIFVLVSIFTATQSELAHQISAGESPGFAWVRDHLAFLVGSALAFLSLVFLVQQLGIRSENKTYRGGIKTLIWMECLGVLILTVASYFQMTALLSPAHSFLLLAILLQGVLTLRRDTLPETRSDFIPLHQQQKGMLLFVVLIFLIGAGFTFFDPTLNVQQDYNYMDTEVEFILIKWLPPVVSGIISMWIGMGTVAILAASKILQKIVSRTPTLAKISFFLPFLVLAGFHAAIWLGTMAHAIHWELNKLNLKSVMLPLFILLAGCGGILFCLTFYRITSRLPRARNKSPIAVVALSMGACLFFPIMWLLTVRRLTRWAWPLLLGSILAGSLLVGYLVLYGNIFNPWFTAFSYLKGAILKTTAVIAAGTLVLAIEEWVSPSIALPKNGLYSIFAIGLMFVLGFIPFITLQKYKEAKAVILQFNELTRVDATYAREFVNFLGLNKWIRLGQDPPINPTPDPWPLPWTLKKTRPSLLPDDFNLLIIVVDALRGDAFHSAGYRRNLTPFLDQWSRKEALSFRRAYSQGGGSFAAFPFLVAGRSRFTLYGPQLYQKNLYLKIAHKEGIKNYMVMKGFGPRAIFPPDFPVTELAIPRPLSDRRSATADEVFASAREAIAKLPKGERFLGFLHLMDVHNDLWKKAEGLDLGDSPRDLYDNNLSYVDRAFAKFVDWLKQEGIYNQTVVVFTSDHGEQFREHGATLHGHTLYEEEIRIPLILLTHTIRGYYDDVPVIAADMAPTTNAAAISNVTSSGEHPLNAAFFFIGIGSGN
jgi:glucan phosphoethanolaminetransferase (alkaline phosphatase superfamily)